MQQTFSDGPLSVTFSGRPLSDETGSWIEDLSVVEISLFGRPLPFSILPEEIQMEILALSEELEWRE